MPLSAITAATRHEGLFCSSAALDPTAGDTTDTYFSILSLSSVILTVSSAGMTGTLHGMKGLQYDVTYKSSSRSCHGHCAKSY